MASFDIIDASGRSYRLVWQERHYLAQLAAVPFLIKFVTYFLMTALQWEENFLRYAVLYLPSYLADGWLLAHLIRLILLDQRWPFRPGGNGEIDAIQRRDRAQGVQAGMVSHALIKFLMMGMAGFMLQLGLSIETASAPPSLPMAMALIAGMAAMLWGFRLVWLYIPLSIGYPARFYLRDIGRGYMASVYMIGLWLTCFLPVFMLTRFLISLIVAPHGGTLDGLPLTAGVIVGFLFVAMDTINALLATAGMTFALRRITGAQGRGQA